MEVDLKLISLLFACVNLLVAFATVRYDTYTSIMIVNNMLALIHKHCNEFTC